MKKKQNKLSLEKFNIARLTNKMRYIYGGGTTEPTDRCNVTDGCYPDPLTQSTIECYMGIGISGDDCPDPDPRND